MSKFSIILGFVLLSGCSNSNIPNIKNYLNNSNAIYLSCPGSDIKFLGNRSTNDVEAYWTDVVIINDTLIVPEFGEYRFKDERDNEKLWWIVGATSYKEGWAKLNSATGKFTATKGTRQFRAVCSHKGKKLNF